MGKIYFLMGGFGFNKTIDRWFMYVCVWTEVFPLHLKHENYFNRKFYSANKIVLNGYICSKLIFLLIKGIGGVGGFIAFFTLKKNVTSLDSQFIIIAKFSKKNTIQFNLYKP